MKTDGAPAAPAGAAAARRRLTAAEFATWRRFVEVTNALRSLLAADLQSTSSLSAADFHVLNALSEAPGRRLRSSDLAEAVDWDRSRLSHHIKRMEGRGLVRREGCSTDHRVAYVTVTPCGTDAFRRAVPPHARAIKRYFADALTPAQVEQLEGIVAALRDHLGPRPAVDEPDNGSRPGAPAGGTASDPSRAGER
jgi:DNA-binding MarR family transcriptional regulator